MKKNVLKLENWQKDFSCQNKINFDTLIETKLNEHKHCFKDNTKKNIFPISKLHLDRLIYILLVDIISNLILKGLNWYKKKYTLHERYFCFQSKCVAGQIIYCNLKVIF